MNNLKYSAITILLPLLLLAASDKAVGNSSYYQTPTEAQKDSSNVKCQDLGSLCPGQGSYKCCDKLVCRAPEVGGVSACLPLPEAEGTPPQEGGVCREVTKVCIPYGEYNCCKGLSCVATSPVNPFGVGVCAIPVVDTPSTYVEECQKEHQVCQPYKKYQCCSGLTCIDPRTLPYPYPLIDSTKIPPGVGVCL